MVFLTYLRITKFIFFNSLDDFLFEIWIKNYSGNKKCVVNRILFNRILTFLKLFKRLLNILMRYLQLKLQNKKKLFQIV